MDKKHFYKELKPEMYDQYCIKTGKFIRNTSISEIFQLVEIHGIKAHEILIKNRGQVSLEWLCTSPECLATLANLQPIEYFIYALSNLLQKQETSHAAHTNLELKIRINKKLCKEYTTPAELELIKNLSRSICKILSSDIPEIVDNHLQIFTLERVVETKGTMIEFQEILNKVIEQIDEGYYSAENVAKRREAKAQWKVQRQIDIAKNFDLALQNAFDELEDIDTLMPVDLVFQKNSTVVRNLRKQRTAVAMKKVNIYMEADNRKEVAKSTKHNYTCTNTTKINLQIRS